MGVARERCPLYVVSDGKGVSMKKLRYAWFSLLLCLTLFAVSGCGGKEKETERPEGAGGQEVQEMMERLLSDRNELPEDGVVTEEEMASIAGMDGTVEFFGKTPEGIAYTWTYSTKNIKNPQEQRLKVVCVADGLDEIREKAEKAGKTPEASGAAGQEEGSGETPGAASEPEEAERKPEYVLGVTLEKFYLAADARLSLSLTEKWETEAVSFYKDTENGLQQLSEAEVSDENGKTVLSVQISEAGDTYYLIGWADVSPEESREETSAAETENAGNETQAGGEAGESLAEGSPSAAGAPEGTAAAAAGSAGTAAASGTAGSPAQTPTEAPETVAPETEPPAPEPTYTCTISIECSTILSNWDSLKESKAPYVPGDGWILGSKTIEFTPGETVYDILVRACGQYGIHMESSYTPAYGSYYIEGINQLYEFDCGSNSGWMYRVNGWYPNYGCSSYEVEDGDKIEWKYTCNLGSDVGGGF